MKHIGIVACSAEGAALCYRTICSEAPDHCGRHTHPEISMHTFPLGDYMKPIYGNRWEGVADLMVASAEKLARIGADFLICPDNTIHQVYDDVVKRSSLPWLHIAEVVAAEAKKRSLQKLGVTGTKYLMEGPVYRDKLGAAGLGHAIPEEEDRAVIHRVIFEELVNGRFLDDSRNAFHEIIGRLKRNGCDAVVLGCTEIPLLVSDDGSPLPTLDSTRLLARAALKLATT